MGLLKDQVDLTWDGFGLVPYKNCPKVWIRSLKTIHYLFVVLCLCYFGYGFLGALALFFPFQLVLVMFLNLMLNRDSFRLFVK